jgi:hypothetical protein
VCGIATTSALLCDEKGAAAMASARYLPFCFVQVQLCPGTSPSNVTTMQSSTCIAELSEDTRFRDASQSLLDNPSGFVNAEDNLISQAMQAARSCTVLAA